MVRRVGYAQDRGRHRAGKRREADGGAEAQSPVISSAPTQDQSTESPPVAASCHLGVVFAGFLSFSSFNLCFCVFDSCLHRSCVPSQGGCWCSVFLCRLSSMSMWDSGFLRCSEYFMWYSLGQGLLRVEAMTHSMTPRMAMFCV